MNFKTVLSNLEKEGNLRKIPSHSESNLIDFTSNDYLGLAADSSLVKDFLSSCSSPAFSSSASRLLASKQKEYSGLERLLANEYGREALVFNSGYHANTGILPAIASQGKNLILADKLVHASIIDGIILSRTEFKRFPHNDMLTLRKHVERNYKEHDSIIIVTESVFSMDGDEAPLEELLNIKKEYPNIVLYLDEAHAFGVKGRKGLGLAHDTSESESWDIIIGTLGKAAASMGAFAICSEDTRDFLINSSRSLIFSTALPPIQAEWSAFILRRIFDMEDERQKLKDLGKRLSSVLRKYDSNDRKEGSHIQPLIIGNPKTTIALSAKLAEKGIKALPIRKPTVPAGTERIRFSLSARMSESDIERLDEALSDIYEAVLQHR